MSYKPTELTESSTSAFPESVLCGYGILNQLPSPWSVASSDHFYPAQTYDGHKAVAPCRHTGPLASNVRRYLWSKKDGPFGKEFPVSEAPTPDGTSGYSDCREMWPGGLILEGPSHTPRTFQPTLATTPTSLPPDSPSSSTARPALIPEVRSSSIQKSRNSLIVTSQQLQPVAGSSRKREELSTFPFPYSQVFQQRDCWPIQFTREDPNKASENQDSVARLFRRVDINSREVIEYANYKTIPVTSSEEMAANLAWYEDELINDFQRTFDNFGRDN
ncbi:hypothetical protein O181_057663 [Austropuccinia psidii MF-1]|uniref:Uncharacterized protein n=1 Tax=Austropuccinia psidii MF-1 TaxID=1389203 RepID=A0A9Q3EFE4_9BASI|nr:hypothetical protein [Austropuccinia psidii MF-1]